jgi:hypothetical protein
VGSIRQAEEGHVSKGGSRVEEVGSRLSRCTVEDRDGIIEVKDQLISFTLEMVERLICSIFEDPPSKDLTLSLSKEGTEPWDPGQPYARDFVLLRR